MVSDCNISIPLVIRISESFVGYIYFNISPYLYNILVYKNFTDMGKTLYTDIIIYYSMGRLDLNIDDELERSFRDVVYKTKGMKKGNLTDSLEEAIDEWITSRQEPKVKKHV
jgi:hypothetical protein